MLLESSASKGRNEAPTWKRVNTRFRPSGKKQKLQLFSSRISSYIIRVRRWRVSLFCLVRERRRDSRLRKISKALGFAFKNEPQKELPRRGSMVNWMVSWDQRRIAFVESTVHSWLVGKESLSFSSKRYSYSSSTKPASYWSQSSRSDQGKKSNRNGMLRKRVAVHKAKRSRYGKEDH